MSNGMVDPEVWVNSSVAQIETVTEMGSEGGTEMSKIEEEWFGTRPLNLSVKHRVFVYPTSDGKLLLEMRENKTVQDGGRQEIGDGMHQPLALEGMMIVQKERVVQQSISGSGKKNK